MKTLSHMAMTAYKEKYRLQKAIDDLKLELLEVTHEMSGLARHGKELSPKQEKSTKPMPKTVSPIHSDQKILKLIEKKEAIEKKIDFLTMSLELANKVDLLSLEDQQIAKDLFHSHKTPEQVASEYGYARSGIYKHLYIELDKIL